MKGSAGVQSRGVEQRSPLVTRLVLGVALLLMVLAVPLFLIASNVRLAVNSSLLYDYGFRTFNIPSATGISMEELQGAGRQIRDYFNNDEEFLDLRVRLGASEVSLYNQRETLHMRDVKGLVQGVYRVQLAAAAYLVLGAAGLLLLARRRGLLKLLRLLRWGGLLTIGLVLGIGLASAVAWNQVFLIFHLLSFDNTLWILDPRSDYLLRMFPSGFFLRATLFIALGAILEGALLALSATLGTRLLRRVGGHSGDHR